MHLTLKFLGEVKEAELESLREALKEVSERAAPFRLCSGELGAFPSKKKPRSLWLGLDISRELNNLKTAIEEALYIRGFSRDKKGYSPHLTLCRIRSREDSRAFTSIIEALRIEKKVAFDVNAFVLYKSILAPQGAKHTIIKEFPLRGGL